MSGTEPISLQALYNIILTTITILHIERQGWKKKINLRQYMVELGFKHKYLTPESGILNIKRDCLPNESK